METPNDKLVQALINALKKQGIPIVPVDPNGHIGAPTPDNRPRG